MRATRRLSQAISEGDGISVLVPVADLDSAQAAEAQGAEGIILRASLERVRDATTLPILWGLDGSPDAARGAGADACLLIVQRLGEDGERLTELHAEVQGLGLECVVGVSDEEELELALATADPEIFLLTSPAVDDDEEAVLERVLDLLPDVPAGKLAIADVAVGSREQVMALERAGIDAVIVRAGDVAHLVGGRPPAV